MMTWIERMLDLGHSANFRLRHTVRISAAVFLLSAGKLFAEERCVPSLFVDGALCRHWGRFFGTSGPSALFIPFDSCVGQA